MTATAPIRRPPAPASDRRRLRFERLLIDGDWADDVRVGITASGEIDAIEPESADTSVQQVRGRTVPGAVNLHSHAFQRALAGAAESAGPEFWGWRRAMYRLADRLTPELAGTVALQLYLELLKSGFTCVGEFHYLHHQSGGEPYEDPAEMSGRVVDAAEAAGIGLVHMPAVYETGGFDDEPLAGAQLRFRLGLEEAMEIAASLPRGPNLSTGLALHSLRAVHPSTLTALEQLHAPDAASGAGTFPVHIHVAEPEREVEECLAKRGARPVEWLLANAPVDGGWCLIHATHLSPAEAAETAGREAVVGLCPTTEANLGDGVFPLTLFSRLGGRFGIGTDSHVSRSPAEELRTLEYGRRLTTKSRTWAGSPPVRGSRRGDRSDGSAGERDAFRSALAGPGGRLLHHAWKDGCRALGWNGGEVAVGRRADLVVLDAGHPVLVERDGSAVLDSWIFSGPENPVRHVMVGGEWVVKDGRHALDEEACLAYARAVKTLSES